MFQFPTYIREAAFGGAVRGHLPGLLTPMHQITPAPAVFSDVRVNGSLFKDVLVLPTPKRNLEINSGHRARLAFDITGPWE